MKLAIDVSQVIYGTGASSYIRYLVPELIKLLDEPPILFSGVLRQNGILNDWLRELKGTHQDKVFPIPPKVADLFWNLLRFSIDPLIGKTDIFHSSDWTQPGSKAKKITTVHDVIAYKFPESLDPYIVKVQKRRMELVKRKCDLIIADSSATKEDLVNILRIDESKARVIHLAAADIFKPQNDDKIGEVKRRYGITKDYLLSVGTREPRKNLQRIVNTYKNLKTKEDLELVLVGKFGWGEDISPVEGVRILGFLKNDELPALYTGAKAFLYPSLYEGFGVPVLEAMACSCPVVTSDRGSLKEIVGDAALIVNPEVEEDIKNAVEILLDLPKIEYNEIKTKSLVNSQKYSWEKTAKETIDAYKELI